MANHRRSRVCTSASKCGWEAAMLYLGRVIRRAATLVFREKEGTEMICQEDVRPALRYLVKALCESSSYFPEDRAYLRKLCSAIYPPDSMAVTMNDDIFKKFGGYVQFLLEQRHLSDKMDKWIDGGHEWSIMSGISVHRSAASIIRHREENHTAGFMMDTTWSVMRLYVTAILIAVSRNTSIPLAFAFRPFEMSKNPGTCCS
jgi:hypothetical protein